VKNKYNNLFSKFNISEKVILFAEKVENNMLEKFSEIERIEEYNQYKVLHAFQKNSISDIHLSGTTGYGYNDIGRDKLDKVYADVFNCEDALVRHTIISGTHALTICLFGLLRPNDLVLSAVGKPYDTLKKVIGANEKEEGHGSLKDFGINYKEVPLNKDNKYNLNNIEKSVKESIDSLKLVLIQRSKGYDYRPSLTISDIKKIVSTVKGINNNIICMVDNCYGEFVEILEPTDVGADIIVGSLIKNPGGGLAPMGGYIAGRKDLIKKISYRHTSPGIGKEAGASLNINSSLFQGFFLAPHIVSQSIKGSIFCGAIFKELGFEICPEVNEKRSDIIQAIKFNSPELVINFCKGIQKGAPIDSFVEPTPWAMPGYDSDVIMASGSFIQGSSIELSADAPIKAPYVAFMQGGLTWKSAKLGILISLQKLLDEGLIEI
jgi:cystathionine beta-lyase family protein involved in aluminum resistance